MGAEVVLVPWDVVLMFLLACTIKSNDFFVHIFLIIFVRNRFIHFQMKLRVLQTDKCTLIFFKRMGKIQFQGQVTLKFDGLTVILTYTWNGYYINIIFMKDL